MMHYILWGMVMHHLGTGIHQELLPLHLLTLDSQ